MYFGINKLKNKMERGQDILKGEKRAHEIEQQARNEMKMMQSNASFEAT